MQLQGAWQGRGGGKRGGVHHTHDYDLAQSSQWCDGPNEQDSMVSGT